MIYLVVPVRRYLSSKAVVDLLSEVVADAKLPR
jgi:hypothetical protein